MSSGRQLPREEKVPKTYRFRLHLLKKEYRRLYRREPDIHRPVTGEAALQAIAFLEAQIARARNDRGQDPRS